VTAFDSAAAILVLLGALGAYWAYRRSVASLESLGEAAAELPPPLEPRARVQVQECARPDVAELNTLAARLEAGETLNAAEHARVAELVRDLERLEHKPVV
jgi:hypothetical protein